MRALVGTLVLATAVVATADIEHTILHGVSVATFRFTMFPDHVPGFTETEANALIRSRLDEAGIPVTSGDGATLWVKATVFSDNSSTCSVTLDGHLVEEATLLRNGRRVRADSWSGGGSILTTTPADCAHAVGEAIDRTMSDFIEMYGAMNPQE